MCYNQQNLFLHYIVKKNLLIIVNYCKKFFIINNVIHYHPTVLVLIYVFKHIYAIMSSLKSFTRISLCTLLWMYPNLENIRSIDADEAGHDSSLTANSRKSVGTS